MFTFEMAQVLKCAHDNIGEAVSLSSPITVVQVTGFQKKLEIEYLENEPSYNLHRNHIVCNINYRKTKVF